MPRRREWGQARAAGCHSHLAFFFDISLREYETSTIVFGYDTDLPGFATAQQSPSPARGAPVDNQKREVSKVRRNFYSNHP
jgi:hypothetical protein